jgi:predicted phosphodiesterase
MFKISKFISKQPFGGKIQYLSDIHYDKFNHTKFKIKKAKGAEVLIIPGDLGNPFTKSFYQFIKVQSEQFKKVIFVPGNHEFFTHHIINPNTTYDDTLQKMREIDMKIDNLSILDKRYIDLIIDNRPLRIFGCTLWSHTPQKYLDKMRNFPDYRRIKYNNNHKLTPEITNQLHRNDVNWLENQLNIMRNLKDKMDCIVVTHHTPLIHGTCNPIFLKNKKGDFCRATRYNYMFSSNLGHLFKPIDSCTTNKVWLFGHTHWKTRFRFGDFLMCQNHLGNRKLQLNDVELICTI